jgi:hypothetical protein
LLSSPFSGNCCIDAHINLFKRINPESKTPNPFYSKKLKPNCRYKVFLHFSWSRDNIILYPNKQKRLPSCPPNQQNQFQSDFKKKLKENQLNSLLKISVQGNTYKVPIALLAGRSEYFKRIIESGMKESKEKSVELKDCRASTFEDFVEFCYYGKIIGENIKNLQSIVDLRCFADRMQASVLTNYCQDLLHQWANAHPIQPENFKDYISVVEQFNIQHYQEKLFAFMYKLAAEGKPDCENEIYNMDESFVKNYVDWLKTLKQARSKQSTVSKKRPAGKLLPGGVRRPPRPSRFYPVFY